MMNSHSQADEWSSLEEAAIAYVCNLGHPSQAVHHDNLCKEVRRVLQKNRSSSAKGEDSPPEFTDTHIKKFDETLE